MKLLDKGIKEAILEGVVAATSWVDREDALGLSSDSMSMLAEKNMFSEPTESSHISVNESYEIALWFNTWGWNDGAGRSYRVGTELQEKALEIWVKDRIHLGDVSAEPSGFGINVRYNHVKLADVPFLELVEGVLETCPSPYKAKVEIRIKKTYSRSWRD